MSDLIRAARLEDLNSILELLYQLSPLKEGVVADKDKVKWILIDIINDKNYHLCVFEDEGKVLGTALLLIQMNLSHGGRSYAHIENVVVDKEYRGKGAGRKMMDYLIEKGKEFDCYKILLNCSKDNIPFYEGCRFFDSGEIEMRLIN